MRAWAALPSFLLFVNFVLKHEEHEGHTKGTKAGRLDRRRLNNSWLKKSGRPGDRVPGWGARSVFDAFLLL